MIGGLIVLLALLVLVFILGPLIPSAVFLLLALYGAISLVRDTITQRKARKK